MAHWKARMQLPTRHNLTFFASSYCWHVTGGNQSTWAIFEGGGSRRSHIKGRRGRRPPTTVGWQKTTRIALSCGIKISPVGSLDYSQSTRVTDGRTDRQTDRQNYDSQDRASIAVSRGKKFSHVRDWWSTPLGWLSSTCDLDLGSGHMAYHRASVIDLYVHTKFHWNRKNFSWTDVRMDRRTYWRTDIPLSNVIRSTQRSHLNIRLSVCCILQPVH